MHNKGVAYSLLIPGTSKVKHLEENVEAASIALSEQEMKELDSLGSSGE